VGRETIGLGGGNLSRELDNWFRFQFNYDHGLYLFEDYPVTRRLDRIIELLENQARPRVALTHPVVPPSEILESFWADWHEEEVECKKKTD